MENYEGFGATEVMVKNVMSDNPLIIKEDEKIKTAATLMSEAKTGSLVVLDSDGDLSGILTEMDIVDDLVSEGLDPEDVRVKDIMSSPVHTIDSNIPIQKAAETMADLEIRRLPVVEGEEMVGIITENDILEISPTLIDITREYKKIRGPRKDEEYGETVVRETSGYCESCGVYSERLRLENGQLLCPECE
ncbi:MAG: CBS domain-containing protein [Candidatus Thermoplasmatota archaeon]|nr:CBS domain-containing protein [Candidatus Thermoplasmatota archaeon]MBS3790987.1 CBS domain-containing protein [Candidatus Thermoplasmatota archaeon]